MKKLFLLVALFATTAFVACSDDDDKVQINLDELVGTWRYTHSVGYEIDEGGGKRRVERGHERCANLFRVQFR